MEINSVGKEKMKRKDKVKASEKNGKCKQFIEHNLVVS